MRFQRTPQTFTHRVEPVLGTRLDVSVRAPNHRASERVLAAVVHEIDRLERVFSIFDSNSELSRWKHDGPDSAEISDELATLLRLGLLWRERSAGVLDAGAGLLVQRWRRAEADGEEPTAAELADLVSQLAVPPYSLDGRIVSKHADCRHLDFNALAKGHIVDLAAAAAWSQLQPHSLVVNIGGDLAHRGAGDVRVHIENPQRRASATPVGSVTISNCGAATSGTSWRGFTVAGQRLGHVIDPRAGRPTTGVLSATIVAETTASADAIATAVTVLGAMDGLAFARRYAHSAFIVDADGVHHQHG